MAVLYGNNAFSILLLSNKKRLSIFLEKVFVFQKICFKLKVLKVFKVFRLSNKNMSISQTGDYFKNLYYHFLEEPTLFLLALKWNP